LLFADRVEVRRTGERSSTAGRRGRGATTRIVARFPVARLYVGSARADWLA
jgi:hypothetical protein